MDMGAIELKGEASGIVPKFNACRAPSEWQHYSIDWQAPKFNDQGVKTSNARFLRVTLNGRVIHEDVEIKGPTPAGLTGKEHAKGPLMFQGNHGPVSYKNIMITSR